MRTSFRVAEAAAGGHVHVCREATVKACGVSVAMPQGAELGFSFVERIAVTGQRLTPRRCRRYRESEFIISIHVLEC